MKKVLYYSLFLCFLLLSKVTLCQTTVSFAYDASGNRISRTVVILKSANITDSVIADTNTTPKIEIPKKFQKNNLTQLAPVVYPNPTKGMVELNIENYETNPTDEYWLFDLKGTLLLNRKDLSEQQNIDLSGKPQGSYILKSIIGGTVYEWHIIKE